MQYVLSRPARKYIRIEPKDPSTRGALMRRPRGCAIQALRAPRSQDPDPLSSRQHHSHHKRCDLEPVRGLQRVSKSYEQIVKETRGEYYVERGGVPLRSSDIKPADPPATGTFLAGAEDHELRSQPLPW